MRQIPVIGLILVAFSGGVLPSVAPAREDSWVSYRLYGTTQVYLVAAEAGATPENVSTGLNVLTPQAADTWLNLSPNAEWFLLETERWGCSGWACLARVRADYSEGGLVMISGAVIHPEGFSAISSDGNRVVWTGEGCGSHSRDLWTSTLSGTSWSLATCLTELSAADWNQGPVISADGVAVLFSCGENICSVNCDGSDLLVEVTLADYPGPGDWSQIHSPDFGADSTIIFEGEATGELIWRKDRQSGEFEIVNAAFSNDNSPCVLPDGRIASLWLNRPGNATGVHELKVMEAEGGSELMLVTSPDDVFDIGIGCGGAEVIFSDGFETGDLSRWVAVRETGSRLGRERETVSPSRPHSTGSRR